MPELTPEQLKQRAKGIGSSEIAAVIGISPFASPLDVFMRKLGLYEDAPDAYTWRGTKWEPFVAQMWAQDHGYKIVPCTETLSKGIAVATLDYEAFEPKNGEKSGNLEIKTTHERYADQWGSDGSSEIPDYYLAQVSWQMLVTQASQTYVAVLICNAALEMRSYVIQRDEELEQLLLQRAEKFWADHVLKKVPPAESDQKKVREYLKARYPKSVTTMLPISETADVAALCLAQLRQKYKDAKREKEECENRLIAMLGDADGIELTGGKITYKTSTASPRWKGVAEDALALLPCTERKRILSKHTAEHGARRLLCSGGWFKQAEGDEE